MLSHPSPLRCRARSVKSARSAGLPILNGLTPPSGALLALVLLASFLPASATASPRQAATGKDNKVDATVRETLQAYEAALESLDAEAVKKVHPSIDVEGLKRAFREMRSLEVDIDNVRVLSADGGSARVSCRVAQTLTPRAGSRQTTTITRVLRLRREGSGWVIQAFER